MDLTPSSCRSRPFLPSPRIWLSGRIEKHNSIEDKIGPLGLTTLAVPSGGPATADLIFVHGLGGGSRKTWTKSDDPSLYWPKEWLPEDEAFQDVRLHTFGYDSMWGKESILGIHDFANALLNSILDCPSIPWDSKAPIILIGHSMGGLVIKRAFLLAVIKQDYASIADRIQGILFLATPHRGSECAQVLSRLLAMKGGKRPFLTDLNRGSEALHSINDEFPGRCQDLLMYSFYETLPTDLGVKKQLIVERDLATMGSANERRAYLNADHRDVCKYFSRSDPNYLVVRNALASVLKILQHRFSSSKLKTSNERRKQLHNLLGVTDAREDDFVSADNLRMNGSVEWLIEKENFQEWIQYDQPPIYSVIAGPATGKTIMSGKVIAHLRKLKKRPSFHFFRYDTNDKANIASFLLSMAWQMADSDERILGVCLQILEKSDHLNTDYRTIWRKLFLDGIFKVSCEHVQYWVIDALDECKNEVEIIPLLMQAAEVSSIHIFITSRNPFEPRQNLRGSPVAVISEGILEQDSKSDITMYLNANMDALPTIDADGQQHIVSQILDKSRGCFLWVSIVVKELRNVHTSSDKQRLLDEVPTDMNELYARILDIMSKASFGKELAKAILTWTVCSTRPLKVAELHEALQLDLNVSIDGLESSIRSCCGQLVTIDQNEQVQMTHLTARQFLLNGTSDSEFAIKEKDGHRRLLLVGLQHLKSYPIKGPGRRRSNVNDISKEGSAFIKYASNSLCDHLTHATSNDRDVLLSLAEFFNSISVLYWIEYIARHYDQQRLVEAGKALETFVQESPELASSASMEAALLSTWATDLVRLVMQFGKDLEAYPAAIYNLIPPFCPSKTALRNQFKPSARDITVRGLRDMTWDDCLATVVDTTEQYLSLASSKKQFSIGCFSGKILLFKQTTCQKIAVLEHDEPVRFLVFGVIKNILVSAGSKSICVWDLESKLPLHVFQVPQQCMALSLDDGDQLLLGALKDHHLNVWDLNTGGSPEVVEWTESLQPMIIRHHRRPATAAFGIDSGLLAVIYKGQDILLWCLATDVLLALYSREHGIVAESTGRPYGSSGVRCLIFGNAPNAHLLVCAYTDGELVLFDTATNMIVKRIVAFAHLLACSADGYILATADPAGTILLFNIETLELVYRIGSIEPSIQALTFSPDGLRLLDIRASRCNIWDLTDLVKGVSPARFRRTANEQGAILEASENAISITSIACDDEGELFFVGKEDGSVNVYDVDSGLPSGQLFTHALGVSIVYLHFEEQSHTLISIDSSSRIMIHILKRHHKHVSAKHVLFEYRAHVAVGQVVCQPGLQRILICSAKSDMLWSITPDKNTRLETIIYEEREPYRWTNHPNDRNQIILITHHKAHIYDWQTLRRLTGETGIELQGNLLPELSIHSITTCFNGTILATSFRASQRSNSKSKLVFWSTSDFTSKSTSAVPVPGYCALSEDVEVLIGSTSATSGQLERLVFLHGSRWVCTTDMRTVKTKCFVRHFFFPANWLSTRKDLDLSMRLTKHGDILLVKADEVAVVRRGLLMPEFVEDPTAPMSLAGLGRRASTASTSLPLRNRGLR